MLFTVFVLNKNQKGVYSSPMITSVICYRLNSSKCNQKKPAVRALNIKEKAESSRRREATGV